MASTRLTAEEAIRRAFIIKGNNPFYSQTDRGDGHRLNNPSYDCSSFIAACWDLGVPWNTEDMQNPGGYGFDKIQWNGHVSSLMRGDVLVTNGKGHTMMYLGNGQGIHCTSSGGSGGVFIVYTGYIESRGFAWILRGRGGIVLVRWIPG